MTKVAKFFKVIKKIYDKHNVEKEIAKENKKSRNFSAIIDIFSLMSFVA